VRKQPSPGLVTARLLGLIEAQQKEKGSTIRNDRLIATAETPKIRPNERSLDDVPARVLAQIEHFFIAYNRFEGRMFVPLRRRGPRIAAQRVARATRERDGARGEQG